MSTKERIVSRIMHYLGDKAKGAEASIQDALGQAYDGGFRAHREMLNALIATAEFAPHSHAFLGTPEPGCPKCGADKVILDAQEPR